MSNKAAGDATDQEVYCNPKSSSNPLSKPKEENKEVKVDEMSPNSAASKTVVPPASECKEDTKMEELKPDFDRMLDISWELGTDNEELYDLENQGDDYEGEIIDENGNFDV